MKSQELQWIPRIELNPTIVLGPTTVLVSPVDIERCPRCHVPVHASESDDPGRCATCSYSETHDVQGASASTIARLVDEHDVDTCPHCKSAP